MSSKNGKKAPNGKPLILRIIILAIAGIMIIGALVGGFIGLL